MPHSGPYSSKRNWTDALDCPGINQVSSKEKKVVAAFVLGNG